jgi:dTDP-glucose pyrophosphorylase
MTMPAIKQAAILCGGLGTRLGQLTTATPKPLLPVGERPFLDILLDDLGQAGVTRILLLAGFMAERIADYAAATPMKKRFGLTVDVAAEPSPAGTGGALWHARDRLDERFFLLNGDSWFDIPLADLGERLAAEEEPLQVPHHRVDCHVGAVVKFDAAAQGENPARVIPLVDLPLAGEPRRQAGDPLGLSEIPVDQPIECRKAAKPVTLAAVVRNTGRCWRIGGGHRNTQRLPGGGQCRDT